MPDKLQELTDRLYQEGLAKGKEEGTRLLQKAKEEAEAIITDARKQAEAILAKAGKEAEDLREKADSDIRMGAAQCLQATKKDIENLVIAGISASKVEDALRDMDFIKEIVREVALRFSSSEASELSIILPESMRHNLEPFVRNELSSMLKAGVKADFSKKIIGGFTIGPADGSYFISLTEDTFKALIAEYLRPVTRKILFG